MVTYNIESEGNAIVPIQIKVSFSVDVSATYTEGVTSNLEGQAFTDFFDAYAREREDYYKNISEFTTKDLTRNSTQTTEYVGVNPDDETKSMYNITINFTINNAQAEITHNTQTSLTGTEKETFLQSEAENAALAFKSARGWVDL